MEDIDGYTCICTWSLQLFLPFEILWYKHMYKTAYLLLSYTLHLCFGSKLENGNANQYEIDV